MNKELWLVIMPALGWLLFALGGTSISDKIKGQKWIRRFILPFLWGICLFLANFAWFQVCGVALLACLMLSLGYGSYTSWKARLGVFTGYGLISAPIGLSVWNIITPIGCVILFLLSNIKLLGKPIIWKIWEGSAGALIGIQISYLLAGYGLVW